MQLDVTLPLSKKPNFMVSILSLCFYLIYDPRSYCILSCLNISNQILGTSIHVGGLPFPAMVAR